MGKLRSMDKPNYMTQLDTLRTFAVAAVAWYHWAPKPLHFGIPWYLGVNLFFVISGFLITGILLDCRWPTALVENTQKGLSLRQFYIRRFLRIFPLYYMVLFILFVWNMKPVRETIYWHLFYGTNFYIMNHGWQGPISHFWSLSVEEQFYIFWPVLVLFSPRRMLLPLVTGLTLSSCLFRVLISVCHLPIMIPSILVIANLDSLGVGALLALLRHSSNTWKPAERIISHHKKILWVSFGGYLFIFMLGVIRGTKPYWLWAFESTFLAIFFVCIIHSVSMGVRGALGKFLAFRPFLYLGKISYGLYVFHNIPMAASVFAAIPGFWPYFEIVPLRLVVQTVWTIGISALSWHLVESPINNLKWKFPYVPKKDIEIPQGLVAEATSEAS
jgi:peptidoglycan/LPS O-acetylase OafA/YrhL